MKLHLNLTLRRAVLAAMALVAVHATQAETITYGKGTADAYITGTGTLAPNEWNQIWNSHKSGTLTIGTHEGAGDITLEGKSTYNKGSIIFIGGAGHDTNATTGNNGTLNVGAATMNLSTALHVGSSVHQTTGTLTINGGTVNAGSELTVGGYAGTGIISSTNGTIKVATDKDGGVFRMGYHNGAGQVKDSIDKATLTNSSITVGAAGGAVDKTSIGHEAGSSELYLKSGSKATFYDQTIVGENGARGLISVDSGSSLTMTGTTTLGWTGGASGQIVVAEGSAATAGILVAGDGGKGELSVDGTLKADSLTLANKAGSKGSLISTGSITTGVLSIGQAGTGTAEISGGSLTATDIILGYEATGNGSLSIGSGVVVSKLNSLFVGNYGTGNLTTASSINTKAAYVVGTASKANISGGTFSSDKLNVVGGAVSTSGSGKLSAGNMTLADGGDLNIGSTGNSVTNLQVNEGSDLAVQKNASISSTTMVNGGSVSIAESATLTSGTSLTNQGTITNAGTLAVSGSMSNLGSLTGAGQTTVATGGSLTLAGSANELGSLANNGTVQVSAGTTTGGVSGSGSATVDSGATWNLNGTSTLTGGLTNDGGIHITGTATTGTVAGSGSATVDSGATWNLNGGTTQDAITNSGTINLSGSSTMVATSLEGAGTTNLLIDKTTGNGSTFITLDEAPTGTVTVDINLTDAASLEGKHVDFVSVNENLIALNQSNIELINDANAKFVDSYIEYNVQTGSDEATGTHNRLHYTTCDGSSADSLTGIKFGVIDANVLRVESGLSAEIYDRVVEGEAADPVAVEEDKIATNVVEATDTVTTVALQCEEKKNGSSDTGTQHDVVIAKNVTTAGTGKLTVSSTVTVQSTVYKESSSSEQVTKTENIGSGGLTVTVSGETELTGSGDNASVFGFQEGAEGTVATKTKDDNNQEVEVVNEVKLIDVLVIQESSKLKVGGIEAHTTHALTMTGGETEETRAKLTLDGGSLFVGGSNDVQLTYDVEVQKYDENGELLGTETVARESANHIITDSKITNADIELSGDANLTFKQIADPEHAGTALGETHINNSTVTLKGGNAKLGVETGVEDKEHPIQLIVFNRNSALQGTGHVHKIHMKHGSILKVGNSPGVLKVTDATFDNTRVQFHFITDSTAWDFSGNTTDSNHDTGAISQLEVDREVKMDNAAIEIVYEKKDATAEDGYGTADKSELAQKFEDGASITLITGDLSQLTGTYSFDAEEWLPELDTGLFWNVDELFTTGKVFVFGEILEEPVRIANSLLSAGDTVLSFGRLTESQAGLRKAGTTRTWGSALGMFDSVDSEGARTGYDYNAWGGAVGVDHAFTSRTVVGAAFGCTWGENEAELDNGYYSGGSIDQDGKMLGLYGVHKFRTKGLMNDVKLSAFAAYGWFENDSDRTALRTGSKAAAEWDSTAWVLSASLSRDITTDSGLVITPFVGVEYTKAEMDDFTEHGKSYDARYSADQDYSNLAVKVGVGISKTIGSFTPYASIAYINDVKRDAPVVTASGKRTITGEASMPGRSAVQLSVGTGVKLSDSWDAYAGYTAELRDKATEHNVNVGVGYTF